MCVCIHIQQLISVLIHDFSTRETIDPNLTVAIHPATILYSVDALIDDINRSSSFWESKLSKLLRACSQKQWQPILLDTQSTLRTVGGNLICLGMVELVGRPVMMLYPIYLVVLEGLKLARQLETQHRLTASSVVSITKLIAYVLICYQLLTILSMYSGLGFTALALGVAAVVLASSDQLTKQVAPVVAPHLNHLDHLFMRLQQAERYLVGGYSQATAHTSSSSGYVSDASAYPSTRTTHAAGSRDNDMYIDTTRRPVNSMDIFSGQAISLIQTLYQTVQNQSTRHQSSSSAYVTSSDTPSDSTTDASRADRVDSASYHTDNGPSTTRAVYGRVVTEESPVYEEFQSSIRMRKFKST